MVKYKAIYWVELKYQFLVQNNKINLYISNENNEICIVMIARYKIDECKFGVTLIRSIKEGRKKLFSCL